MQTTHKIAGGSATGYATYLTNPSDRGDYYTTAGTEGEGDGQENRVAGAQGRWHGSPELLAPMPASFALNRTRRGEKPLCADV